MDFQSAVRAGIQNYANFEGRALRSEYWWWMVFVVVAGWVLAFVDSVIGIFSIFGYGPFSWLFSLATIIPGISVAVRRLHDGGRSGWWLLLVLLPVIGWLVLLYFYVLKGTEGPNEYGPEPTGTAPAAD